MTRRRLRLALPIALCLLLSACGGRSGLTKADQELGLEPQDSPAELYVKMAEEYYARGQLEIAFRRAQQAIKADPKYPRAQAWVAFLFEELQQTDQATKHYEQAVKLAPNNADILNAYGSFLCRQKQYAEADTYFTKALTNPVYSTPWIAMTNAGDCAADAGNVAKAESYYHSAMQASTSFGAPLVQLAALAMQRGDAKTAKGYIDRYFSPQTRRTAKISYKALTVGAQAERALGNRKKAAYYEQALKANYPQAPNTRDL